MKLTEQQLNNLKVFLARVQLSGAEVQAFNDLVNTIFSQPELPKEEKADKSEEA